MSKIPWHCPFKWKNTLLEFSIRYSSNRPPSCLLTKSQLPPPRFCNYEHSVLYTRVEWFLKNKIVLNTRTFLSLCQGGMSPLGLLEAKKLRKSFKKLVFLWPGKNQFAHFGGPSKNVKILFRTFFLGDCSLKY